MAFTFSTVLDCLYQVSFPLLLTMSDFDWSHDHKICSGLFKLLGEGLSFDCAFPVSIL